MTEIVNIEAPAKINLTLDVFAPRSDGFHDLDSIVIKMTPVDTLTVNVEQSDRSLLRFTCDEPALPTDERNLVVRAAHAALAASAARASVQIHLTKRLPMEAGLGGGSSDAAATLRGLASLLGLSQQTVFSIAASLGSDIPLFLTPGIVRMQGRGEKVTSITRPIPLFGVLVRPSVGVPTGPAYRLLDSIPHRIPGSSTRRMLDFLIQEPAGDGISAQVAPLLHNDFEAAVLPAYPEVAAASRALTEAGAIRTLLCGSGSALFGMTRSEEETDHLYEALIGRFPFVTRTVTYHE